MLRVVLAWLLFCTVATAQVGQQPRYIQPVVGGTPFALDGAVASGQSTGNIVLSGLTTTFGSDIIYVACANTATITAVASGGGNITFTTRRVGNAATNNTEMWVGKATNPLSGEVITVTQSGGPNTTCAAAAFSGAHFASPFDGNAAIPAFSAGPPTYTTSNANDILIASQQNQGTPSTARSGCNLLFSTLNLGFAYCIVSATQSASANALSSAFFGAVTADAIIQGP